RAARPRRWPRTGARRRRFPSRIWASSQADAPPARVRAVAELPSRQEPAAVAPEAPRPRLAPERARRGQAAEPELASEQVPAPEAGSGLAGRPPGAPRW